MNTRLMYMLRDAANYKIHHATTFAGTGPIPMQPDDRFLPHQVDLLVLHFGGHYDDDDPWHEVVAVEVTPDPPDDDRTWEFFAGLWSATEWKDLVRQHDCPSCQCWVER